MRVLVQNKRTNLTREAVSNFPDAISVLPVEYLREDEGYNSFLHSKFYAFEKNDHVELFVGSANCSRAALLSSGINGNAELLTKVVLKKNEYEKSFLSELEFVDNKLELSTKVENDSLPQEEMHFKINAVRQFGNEIKISFKLPESFSISACYIDCQKYDFEITNKDSIAVKVTYDPHRVYVEATNNNSIIKSPMFWVDNEVQLQATSKDRKLANIIDSNIQYGQWNIGGWVEILKLIHSNLDYESKIQTRRLPSFADTENDEGKHFGYNDVFSDDYSLLLKHGNAIKYSEVKRLHGFQQMLLSWFGAGCKSDFYDNSLDNNNEAGIDESLGETEDRTKAFKKQIPQHQDLTEKEKQRALKTARRIVKKIISKRFINARPAALLGIDLSIIGTMLCSGLCERWLGNEDFYDLSYDIWHAYFFDASIKDGKHGWIEVLCELTCL